MVARKWYILEYIPFFASQIARKNQNGMNLMHLLFTENGKGSSTFRGGYLGLPIYEQVIIPNGENWEDGQCGVLFSKSNRRFIHITSK